eukprot:CAMPEP_0170215018 /NCGR_PEP_ID=MMETSP0116_2-20130129/7142_1 /TAXON_ID=400756 /ORGANISM="Durinskia baltica, Strain CSIRO CS-38" /LENGTH=105 /DNA_ID=CAMNT_0010465587 /DNA_START=91 /DNA_END=408 /DNA_ORIENTATION=+
MPTIAKRPESHGLTSTGCEAQERRGFSLTSAESEMEPPSGSQEPALDWKLLVASESPKLVDPDSGSGNAALNDGTNGAAQGCCMGEHIAVIAGMAKRVCPTEEPV